MTNDRTGMLGRYVAFVIIVALLSLIYVSCDVSSIKTRDYHPRFAKADSVRVIIDDGLVMKDPLAILVLDLSASMKANDPEFRQYEAVAAFLRAYRHVAAGAIAKGGAPKLSIVLFSGVARPVAFGDKLWAELGSEDDVARILEFMSGIVGAPGAGTQPDPRLGRHTDHVAAARTVRAIVEEFRARGNGSSLPGSVCVVFMTDGKYDPSPLADASLTPAELASSRQKYWDAVSSMPMRGESGPQVDGLRDEFDAWLAECQQPLVLGVPYGVRDLFPITMLRQAGADHFSAGAAWYDRSLTAMGWSRTTELSAAEVRRLCGLDADDAFAPIQLVATEGVAADWGGAIDARDLTFSFAGALADWLELRTIPVADDAIHVQPDARALVVLASDHEGPVAGYLESAGQRVALANGLALVSAPSPGRWRLALRTAGEASVKAYSDVRYRWVFRERPREFSILNEEARIVLALCDAERHGAPVPLASVYARFPEELACTLTLDRAALGEILMQWSVVDTAFVSVLPRTAAQHPGDLSLHVRVEGFVYVNGMAAGQQVVTAVVPIGDAVDIELFSGDAEDRHQIEAIEEVTVRRGERIGAAPAKGGRHE